MTLLHGRMPRKRRSVLFCCCVYVSTMPKCSVKAPLCQPHTPTLASGNIALHG